MIFQTEPVDEPRSVIGSSASFPMVANGADKVREGGLAILESFANVVVNALPAQPRFAKGLHKE